MQGEYNTFSLQNTESTVLFFGQEDCTPGYFFKGNNTRQNYVIHYIKSGEGYFSSANHSTVKLQAGDLFILPKGVPCFYQADSKNPWSYLWIGFSGTKIKSMLEASNILSKNYLKQISETHLKTSLVALFKQLHAPHTLANDVLIDSLIYRAFYDLITEFPNSSEKTKTNTKNHSQIKVAIKYIENNYSSPRCTITQICHKLDISRSYLYSLFKNTLSISPQKYLMQYRMEHAKDLLKTSTIPIQNIASKVGYSDEFTFSKAFKRYTGFSPLTFRKNS